MSSFMDLLRLPPPELAGSFHTAREIAQQPELWTRVIDLLERRAGELSAFLRDARPDAVILCGAGTSAFIGKSIAPVLRSALGREVIPAATTSIVTNPGSFLVSGRPYVVVHFARSGDSPESLAAYRLLRARRPDASHLVITCNPGGALAGEAARDPRSFLFFLPEEANDRSLAMTSSFTAMALCGISLGYLPRLEGLRAAMAPAGRAVRRILEQHDDVIARFARESFSRACYLGSHALEGAMEEAALKMLEMTGGAVAALSNSFLGIRHGPLVFIDSSCALVACVAGDPRVRRYELDLLRDVRARGQASGVLAITAGEDPALRDLADAHVSLGEEVPDELRVLTDVVACQLLAFFAARARGLAPDSPSRDGIISRVVQGVRIYE